MGKAKKHKKKKLRDMLPKPKDNNVRVPKKLKLDIKASGVFFGGRGQFKKDRYAGMPQGEDGNIVIIGGNGSGKSSGIIKPTLETWKGAVCATDLKGELSDHYAQFYEVSSAQGVLPRPYIIFDPMKADSLSYDPFWWPAHDSPANLIKNIYEIALALIPDAPNDIQPFWVRTERDVLAAALLHFFQLGLSFSEAICRILQSPLSGLCTEMISSPDVRVKLLLGNLSDMKDEALASIDRGIRNQLMLFGTDPYISHAFRGEREGADCFTWEDLNEFNIFLRLPADRLEQWGAAVTLMYTQLIHHLERRPERHSESGEDNVQTLLLLDEFARFGKLEMILPAVSTLRSKNVNICLVVQSIAQLDDVYGEYKRRILLDNCQYQAILRANDSETQKYLSELIGTRVQVQHSAGKQLNRSMDIRGYSVQISETRDWAVHPHELSTLTDVLLLTPHGFCRVEKYTQHEFLQRSLRGQSACRNLGCSEEKSEGVVKMMSIQERLKQANQRVAANTHKQRLAQREANEAAKKQNRWRNYIIGEMVTRCFPEVTRFEPGNADETALRFAPLEAFLSVLASDEQLVAQLKERAQRLLDSEGTNGSNM